MSRKHRDTRTSPPGGEHGGSAVHNQSLGELQHVLADASLSRLLLNDEGAGVRLPHLGGHVDVEAYVQTAVRIHFDEDHGAPYWREVASELSFDPREAITGPGDLSKLPVADEAALRTRPVTDFLPELFSHSEIDLSKSSGTTGIKKVMPWRRTLSADMARWYEWHVTRQSTAGGDWLVVGPYGLYEKHLEGAANRCGGFCHFTGIEPKGLKHQLRALERGLEAPWRFLDPRASVPAVKGLIRTRVAQEAAVEDVQSQPIEHVASAVPFVERLHEAFASADSVSSPEDIETVLLSGTNVDAADLDRLADRYPNASLIPMYATSFTGAAFSTPGPEHIAYYPMAPVALFDVIDPATGETVPYGERGRVVISRIGEDFLWPNQRERESAIRVPPPDDLAIGWDGIADIQSLPSSPA